MLADETSAIAIPAIVAAPIAHMSFFMLLFLSLSFGQSSDTTKENALCDSLNQIG